MRAIKNAISWIGRLGRKHSFAAAGGILLLWQVLRAIIGFAGDIDLIVDRLHEPGWIGVMMRWLLEPQPAALTIALILIGLSLIWWDFNRDRHSRKRLGLTNAVKLMYDEANEDLRRAARKPDPRAKISIVGWCKAALICAARDGICTLYGRREPDLVHESIPRDELPRLWSGDNDTITGMYDDEPKYHDVEIESVDLRRVLKHYEDDIEKWARLGVH